MSRLMSVTLTEQAVVERRKTVTRRLGWWKTRKGVRILQAGDRLTLCRKVMGRRRRCEHPGAPLLTQRCPWCDDTDYVVDPLVRLADVEVTSVRRERLWDITLADIEREGVDPALWHPFMPETTTSRQCVGWVSWFCHEQGVTPDTEVTRIEWRYLDDQAATTQLTLGAAS